MGNKSPSNFHLPKLSWMLMLVCVPASVNGYTTRSPKENEVLLKEARIILPQTDNDGNGLSALKVILEGKIVDLFGGYSNFEGVGGFKSDHTGLLTREKIWYYDIAAPVDQLSNDKFLKLALWLQEAAKQDSVYLRLPNGSVQFVKKGL